MKILKMLHAHIIMFHFFSYIIICICKPYHGQIFANSGESVTLKCDLEKSAGTLCSWVKDGFLVDTFSRRYELKDGCDLTVSPVLPLDQGEYKCQVGGKKPMVSTVGILSINMEPGHPEIDAKEVVMVDRDEVLELECQSSGGKPAGEIHWWNAESGEKIVSETINNIQREGGSFKSTSRIKFLPENSMTINCSVHSDSFPVMKFSNPIKIKHYGELFNIDVTIGDSFDLDCDDTGNLNNIYAWSINNVKLQGEQSRTLTVENFIEAYDGAMISCAIGKRTLRKFILHNVKIDKPKSENNIKNARQYESDIEADEVRKGVDKNRPKRQTVYTCSFVDDEEEDAPMPKFVTLKKFKNHKIATGVDASNKKYSCKTFSNKNSLHQVKRKMKSIAKQINGLHRQIRNNLEY